MPDFVYRFTSLPRPLEPQYPTNAAIALLMSMSALALTVYYLAIRRAPIGFSLFAGALLGLTVFFSWALAREIDPDHPLSAFAAAGITLLGAFGFATFPDLLAIIFLLIGTRILNRSVGPPATVLDSALLLILAGTLALRADWIYPLIAANIFLLDSWLYKPNRRQLGFFVAALAVMGIAIFLGGGVFPSIRLTVFALFGIILTVLLIIMKIISTTQITSISDLTAERLSVVRVVSAQLMVLFTCFFVAIWDGTIGVLDLFPLWATLIGVSAYQLLNESSIQHDLPDSQTLDEDKMDNPDDASTD